MDFFAEQDRARRSSRWLVLWFAAAVLVIVLAVDLVFALTAHFWSGAPIADLKPNFHFGSVAVVLAIVGGGALIRIIQLGKGGEAVAQMVGARAVAADTRDLLERRLLNVVEEMAIAAGLTVPRVYVLDREQGINAFAAGYSPNEAIIAVNRGTLTQLTREQLQGVIGHEFSHILHGDMRLNIRLLGWLSGLLGIFVLGRLVIRVGARADDIRALIPALLLGGALCAVGYLGVILGEMIQAAVSRQREFLADASSVQYTRNPEGIGGALRRIGGWTQGTLIAHPHGESLSYMCFGAAVSRMVSGLFATHPSVAERVRRIYGRRMAVIEAEPPPPLPEEALVREFAAPARKLRTRAALDPAGVVASVARVTREQVDLAHAFRSTLDPLIVAALQAHGGAQNVVAVCLLLLEPGQRARQMVLLEQELDAPAFGNLVELIAPIEALGEARQLDLVELTLPALRELPAEPCRQFLERMGRLAMIDRILSLPELLLYTLVEYRLSKRVTACRMRSPQTLPRLSQAAGLVLSAVARASSRDTPLAFAEGRAQLAARCPAIAFAGEQADDAIALRRALEQLLFLTPMDKPLLLRAAVAAVSFDGSVSPRESLLLRALCATLDVPLPPLLASS
ncbi:MAG: M48 family metalloprotease [Sterolibacteriaceae bacterium]|nr:M48 family metalloprotease [Sterolibacteriaceae bacterium]